MVKWKIVELPFARTLNIEMNAVRVEMPSGEVCIVPLFHVGLPCDNSRADVQALLAEKQEEFNAILKEYQDGTYNEAVEFSGEPKSAMIFISEPLEIRRDVPYNNVTAHARIGVACFPEEIDMTQFEV
jgi:hypothetical protein